eukprot:symbB.v1.2.001576.t1/scaffold88.1/size340390/11
MKHIVLMTIGTGVGGAIMCDGRLLRGSQGQAGEIGHSILVPDGRPFGVAGVHGILEGYASASAVAIRAKEALPPDSSLSTLEAVDCKDVFKHAEAGDRYASDLVQDTARCLAIGCINCCRFVDPELILFSGGMAEAGEALLKEIRRPEPSNRRTASSVHDISMEFHLPQLAAFGICQAMSKAAGKGKGSPPPPPPPSAAGYGKAGGKAAGKAAGKATKSDATVTSSSSAFISLVLRRLTGDEIPVEAQLDGMVDTLRISVGKQLGVSRHRIKLLREGQVLNNSSTVRESGLEDGNVLTAIILPPVYAALGGAGIKAPDEVIAAKMDLHDALSQAGKLKPIHTATSA